MAIEFKEDRNVVKVNPRDLNNIIIQEVSNDVTISASGPQGIQGPAGPAGSAGVGIANGGLPGQVLTKASLTDYDTVWIENYSTSLKHYVKNGSGIPLLKGQAVYITGADGTDVLIALASNDTEAKSSKTLGLLDQNLATNQHGYVTEVGVVKGLNTNDANAGDPVWLGVDGNLIYGLISKPVAPAHLVYIGVVSRKQTNNGEILVRVQNGFEFGELHDVRITNPQNNQILKYDSATGLWKNSSDSAGISSITAGTGLTGGTITSSGTIAIDSNVVAQLTASQTFVGAQNLVASGASIVPLTIKGYTSQSGNLLEVTNSSNTVVAKINSTGSLFANTVSTLNSYATLSEQNSGGLVTLTKQTTTITSPGADKAGVYFGSGETDGSLRLSLKAGTSGEEVTLLQNIPQTSGTAGAKLGSIIIEGGNA
jgi:hypothetical protein